MRVSAAPRRSIPLGLATRLLTSYGNPGAGSAGQPDSVRRTARPIVV